MTIQGALKDGLRRLRARRVPEPQASAEWILAEAMGVSRPALRLKAAQPVEGSSLRRFRSWIRLRARRVPLAYVLGNQDFMGLKLRVNPRVLIPRPETEELVEAFLSLFNSPKLRLLDIGTGSGCIALALARRLPQAEVWATDLSPAAVSVARANARRLGLSGRIRFGPLSPDLRFDGVVSNPPYIPAPALDLLPPEVRREPRLALDGGRDGLKVLRSAARLAKRRLVPGGWVALEINQDQGSRVRDLLEGLGFADVSIRKDLSGLDRIALARRGTVP